MRPAIVVSALIAFASTHTAIAQSAGGDRVGSYSVALLDEFGNPLQTFQRGGRVYVLGAHGQRYSVRVRNDSSKRVEMVIAVDGRDVIDGQPSSWSKRGYLLGAHEQMVVDGFRLNNDSVAAFRFSSVSRSYAAQMGDARDVGVLGVAVFPEWAPRYVRPNVGIEDKSTLGASREDVAPAPASAAPTANTGAPMHAKKLAQAEERAGLGTEFGEQRESHVTTVDFTRESDAPAAVLSVRYNDRPGLLALGIDVDHWHLARDDRWERETAQPFRRDPPFAQPPPGWQPR